MHHWSSFFTVNGALQDLCMYVCQANSAFHPSGVGKLVPGNTRY